jgi:hypothetical protein
MTTKEDKQKQGQWQGQQQRQKQIPFGDDNQRGQAETRATARTITTAEADPLRG